MTLPEASDDRVIFGIGLGRTGTTSLGQALDILGYPAIHYPHDERTERELWAGEPLSILERYRAVVDTSVSPFYMALDSLYPSAKFVLTVRDKEPWLRSVERHADRLDRAEPYLAPQFRHFSQRLRLQLYGTPSFDRAAYGQAYDRHHAAVRAHFAGRPGKLLELDVERGAAWEELCAFLGARRPDAIFPRANDSIGGDRWVDQVIQICAEIEAHTSAVDRVAIVDRAAIAPFELSSRELVPYLYDDTTGSSWPPKDDADAIEHLEQARRAGATVLAIPATSAWWLEHYPAFAGHLEHAYRLRFASGELRLVDLG